MPKETLEYYRYQKAYSRLEKGSPHFEKIRESDLEDLDKQLPEGCNSSLLHNYFCWHDRDNDLFIYYHFENKDEMMGYKAAVYKNPEIYHEWKRNEAEQKELREYNYANTR